MLSISLEHYLLLSLIVFCLGLATVIKNQQNLLIMLMGAEIMLLACLLIFVCFSKLYNTIEGIIFSLVIIALSAVKLALGISLFILYFQRHKNLSIKKLIILKK